MSLLGGIAKAISGVAGAADIFSTVGNYQREQKEYKRQKRLQRQVFAREDTAVQRRVADLKAAGLSPTLAAGSAAQTSGPIKAEPAKLGKMSESAMAAMNLLQMKANIEKTNAQKQAIKLQQEKTKQETAFMRNMNPLKVAGKRMENAFYQASRPAVLERMALENRGKGLQNAAREINNQLDRLKITNKQVSIVRNRLGERLDELRINSLEKDLIAKNVAIRMARENAQLLESNAQWYQSRGLPTNAGLDMYTRGATWFGDQFRNSVFGQAVTESARKLFGD